VNQPAYKGHVVEYRAYHDARRRCLNPKCADYPNYGGRGIQFLFASFEEFFDVLGERPPGKMLDRINNDGHYEKGNVRWASRAVSLKNQRHPKIASLANFTTSELLAELAKRISKGEIKCSL
jgi:hypothetical protein